MFFRESEEELLYEYPNFYTEPPERDAGMEEKNDEYNYNENDESKDCLLNESRSYYEGGDQSKME